MTSHRQRGAPSLVTSTPMSRVSKSMISAGTMEESLSLQHPSSTALIVVRGDESLRREEREMIFTHFPSYYSGRS